MKKYGDSGEITELDRTARTPHEYARNGDLDSDPSAPGRAVLYGLLFSAILVAIVVLAIRAL